MQAVGELDDQDAGVLGHGDDHLAHGLGLRGLAELDLVQLGDAVDEQGDHVAEVTAQVLQAVLGVLDGVVQQARHQRGRVHAQLGEDGGDRERVRDVRVAALALLAAVPAFGNLVGALDLAEGGVLDLRVIAAHYPQQRLQDRVVRVRALDAEPGQAGADAVGGAGAAVLHRGRAHDGGWAGRSAGVAGLGREDSADFSTGAAGACSTAPWVSFLAVDTVGAGFAAGAEAGSGLAAVSLWASSGKRAPRARSGSPGQAPETPW